MKSPICDLLGIEFPLVAFTYCRDVVVEVSKAGGMGVLEPRAMAPSNLKLNSAGSTSTSTVTYGVDLIATTSMVNKDDSMSPDELAAMVPMS